MASGTEPHSNHIKNRFKKSLVYQHHRLLPGTLMLKLTCPWLPNILPLGIPSSHFLPDSILSCLPQWSFCPPSVLVPVLYP